MQVVAVRSLVRGWAEVCPTTAQGEVSIDSAGKCRKSQRTNVARGYNNTREKTSRSTHRRQKSFPQHPATCSCLRRESQPLAQCWSPRQTSESEPLVLWGHYVADGSCVVGRPAVTSAQPPYARTFQPRDCRLWTYLLLSQASTDRAWKLSTIPCSSVIAIPQLWVDLRRESPLSWIPSIESSKSSSENAILGVYSGWVRYIK